MRFRHPHIHRDVLERAPAPALTTDDNGAVLSVVYVTAQPTFTGVIGGFSTVGSDDSSPTTEVSQPQATAAASSQAVDTPTASSPSSQPQPQTFISGFASPSAASSTASSAVAVASTALTSTASLATNLVTSSHVATTSSAHSASYANTAVAGAATTDSSSASESSSSGMSTGGKIGLAVGIIAVIAAIAGLILFFLAKKRKQQEQHEKLNDEKSTGFGASATAAGNKSSAPNAPRLSLRPVSELAPGFMGGNQARNRTSQGNMLTTISEKNNSTGMRNMSPAGPMQQSASNRPRTGDNPFQDPENPFADPEKALGAPAGRGPPSVAPAAIAAQVAMRGASAGQQQAAPVPSVDAFPLPQSHSPSNDVQSSRSAPVPAPITVPNATNIEASAPSPVVAQGPGPEMPAGNVYRIMMEFKPTMPDELELRAGQLVRLLHEYDDGWALCIRLDRSQQGVVPRTCLAAKPSKPRPGPPPGSRPMTPQGRSRGPPPGPANGSPRVQGPPQHHQAPSALPSETGAFNQSPRPLSPGPRPQKRSQSPGPYGAGGPKPMAPAQQRRRSNSAGALNVRNKRNSPPGPSKLGPGSPVIRSNSPGLAI